MPALAHAHAVKPTASAPVLTPAPHPGPQGTRGSSLVDTAGVVPAETSIHSAPPHPPPQPQESAPSDPSCSPLGRTACPVPQVITSAPRPPGFVSVPHLMAERWPLRQMQCGPWEPLFPCFSPSHKGSAAGVGLGWGRAVPVASPSPGPATRVPYLSAAAVPAVQRRLPSDPSLTTQS